MIELVGKMGNGKQMKYNGVEGKGGVTGSFYKNLDPKLTTNIKGLVKKIEKRNVQF